jgi:tetratricopeptide (TPR) repeat protein
MSCHRRIVFAFLAWLLWCCASPAQPSGDADLRQGLIALGKGDLAGARKFLESAAKRDPRSGVVWVALAQTYLRSGQKDAAAQAAGRAEQFGGDIPPIQHALALFYAGIGDSPRASDWERRYASTPGAGVESAASAAELSLNAGQPQEALKWAQTALGRQDTPEMHHLLGMAYQATGKLDAALPELRTAAKAAPAKELFVSDYAQALLQRLDFAEALVVLDAARERFPKSPQILLSFGVACYGERRFADSVGAFLQVIRLDGSIEQPYLFLGRLLEHAGDRLPEVIGAYAAWERKAPDNYLPVFLYAKALAAASAPNEAAVETKLRRSILLNDSHWESHLELGVLLLRRGSWQESARELSRSIRLNPRDASAHYHLARAYLRLGKPELAQAERAEYQRLKDAEDAAGVL